MGCLLLLAACSGKARSNDDASAEAASDSLSFHLPEVPSVLTSVEDRMNFLVVHYWDLFNFRDTNCMHVPEVTEQALVDYLDLQSRLEQPAMVDSTVNVLIDRASVNQKVLNYFIDTSRRYLYDPNSPLRNEELYKHWATVVAQREEVNLTLQMRAEHDLKMIAINRPGMAATDFAYTLRSGGHGRLSQLRANRILLFFYNPDCDHCEQVMAVMKQSQVLEEACRSGRLTVLAVYADAEQEVWEKCKGEIPALWMDAYDPDRVVLDRELYDLTAMPTLYLLDAQKRVVLKDAPFDQVELYLQQH